VDLDYYPTLFQDKNSPPPLLNIDINMIWLKKYFSDVIDNNNELLKPYETLPFDVINSKHVPKEEGKLSK